MYLRKFRLLSSAVLMLAGTSSIGTLLATDTNPSSIPAGRTATVAKVRTLNNKVLARHARLQATQFSPSAFLRSDVYAVLQERAAALDALAQEDPQAVLSLAFSDELLSDLAAKFPDSASLLESHGTWEASIERFVIDGQDAESHRTITRMKIGDRSVEVHFAGSEPTALVSGDVVKADGVLTATRLVATAGATVTSAATCSTTGVQNVIAILAAPPGVTPPAGITAQSVSNTLFSSAGPSMSGFWSEASNGQASASGIAVGWYTLPTTYTCDLPNALINDAITVAANSGVNFQNYSRVFVVVPSFGCGWADLASLGCGQWNTPSGTITASTALLNANTLALSPSKALWTACHAGGHNLGLDHARGLGFGSQALGPIGTAGAITSYGDVFSAMSTVSALHYAAPQKAELLKWMAPGTNYAVVQDSGTWSLSPVEVSSAGLQALKIQRGTGNNAWLWVEYRQPLGNYDSSLSSQSEIFTGALIHYEDGTQGLASDLINFTPSNTSFMSSALPAGQTWTDPYSNLSITVQSATSTALTVSVNYGATACTHSNPAVSMSPANPSAQAGTNVSYTVSITNQDSAGCSASTFNLASTQSTGWAGSTSPTTLTLTPGQTATATLTESVPANAAPAMYSLAASAVNGAYTGSGTANCTVVAPATLTDSVSVGASTYSSRQTVTAISRVLNGTSGAAGASVSFVMTKPNGSAVTGTATADSTGTASWSYKIGQKDPTGAWSVTSKAVFNAQTATGNVATFNVK